MKILKITAIVLLALFGCIVILGLLARIYSPTYFIPYLIEKVEEETNGRYSLAINSDSVQVRIISMSLNLGPTEFRRDTSIQVNSGIGFLDKFDVYAGFQSLKINSLHILKFALFKQIEIDDISFDRPNIVIRKNINYVPDNEGVIEEGDVALSDVNYDADSVLADTTALEEFHQSRNAFLPEMSLDNFSIKGATFAFYDGRKKYPIQEVQGLDFSFSGFESDETDDISVEDASIYISSASSLVSRNIARLTVEGVSINPDSIHVDSLHFGHIIDPYQINKIRGFRASWLDIGVKNLGVEGLHPGELINDSTILIDKISIGNVGLHLFKDKEELKINPAHKGLPSENIRNIPALVKIDTVQIKHGDLVIDMEAPKADAPGRIALNQFHAQIQNITNIPEYLSINPMMQLNADFAIMNSANLNLNATFKIDSPEDQFWVTCNSAPFDVTILNSFIGSQFFIEFSDGSIESMSFEFEGNNKANVGTLDLEYNDLKIQKLQDHEKYMEGNPNTGFIAGVGNFLIQHNRSKQDNNYKPGVIYYEKEYNRDFIHGTIMAMLSGITSSLGFTSKNLEKKQEEAAHLDETTTQASEEEALEKAEEAEEQMEAENEKEKKQEEREARKEARKEKKEKN